MDVAVLHALYNYALQRSDREVLNDFQFVRSARSLVLPMILEAFDSFPQSEQRTLIASFVRLNFQNHLPLWGDGFSPEDLEKTRSIGYRIKRNLDFGNRPMRRIKRTEKQAGFDLMNELMAACPGFLRRKVRTSDAYMAECRTDRVCIDVAFRFDRWCNLDMHYIVYPIGYQPVDYVGEVLSVNSPDFRWCYWSPLQLMGIPTGAAFLFDTDEELRTACADLCNEASSFLREIDAHFDAANSDNSGQ